MLHDLFIANFGKEVHRLKELHCESRDAVESNHAHVVRIVFKKHVSSITASFLCSDNMKMLTVVTLFVQITITMATESDITAAVKQLLVHEKVLHLLVLSDNYTIGKISKLNIIQTDAMT